MKRLLTIFSILLSFTAFAQLPNEQGLGSTSIEWWQKGITGADLGIRWRSSFSDTTALNNYKSGILKNIAGLVCRTVDDLWMRSNNLQRWIKITGSGGGGSSDTVAVKSPMYVISGGVHDTIAILFASRIQSGALSDTGYKHFDSSYQSVTALNDSTLRFIRGDGNHTDILVKGTGSGAGGSPNTSVGSGYRVAINGTNNVKSLTAGIWINIDSLVANQVNFQVDTSLVVARIKQIAHDSVDNKGGDYWSKTGNNLYNKDASNRVGIGTPDPFQRFHIQGQRETFYSEDTLPYLSFIFYDTTGSVRAGASNNGAWDTIGRMSYAFGYNNSATGDLSFVSGGFLNKAANFNSFIGGGQSDTALGSNSVILGGFSNIASGDNSAIIGGFNDTATASQSSIIAGEQSKSTASNSLIAGAYVSQATGSESAVIASNFGKASGQSSLAAGGLYNSALKDGSIAMGSYITANGIGSFGIGLNPNSTTTDEIISDSTMAIMRGKIGINTVKPTQRFEVNGQVRIDSLNNGTAGTDSLVVVNNGVLKRIIANYYNTSNIYNSDGTQTDANRNYNMGYGGGYRTLYFGKIAERAFFTLQNHSGVGYGFFQMYASDSVSQQTTSLGGSPSSTPAYLQLRTDKNGDGTNFKIYKDSAVITHFPLTKLRYNFGKDTFFIKGQMPISSSASDSVLVKDNNGVFKTRAQSDISAAGGGITALTGDGTAIGPGSATLTLATVNSNVGSFTNANITVNAKGLITAASNGTASLTSANFVYNEEFTGSTSSTYTLANTPVTGKLVVFKNGVKLPASEFSLTGAVVTLTSSRVSGDVFSNDYIK